jgi:uncharacterized protein YidB (DUF937 family)
MGMFDNLLKQALAGGAGGGTLAGLMEVVSRNPKVAGALIGLIGAGGGSGGLAGLIEAFRDKGLGDLMSAWIATGPNPPITPAQLSDVLGGERLGEFARQAGIALPEAAPLLAGVLPTVVDKLTPDGKVPDQASLEKTLGTLSALFCR